MFSRVELIDGRFGVLRRLHRYKTEPTRVAGVGVVHDRCFLDLGKNINKARPGRAYNVTTYLAYFVEDGFKFA